MGVRPGGRVDEARHVRQTEGPGVRRKRASAERGGGEGAGGPWSGEPSLQEATVWAGGPPGRDWRSLVLSFCAGRAAVTPCVEVGGWGWWCGVVRSPQGLEAPGKLL